MYLNRRQSVLGGLGLLSGLGVKANAQDSAPQLKSSADSKNSKHLQPYLPSPKVIGTGSYRVWGFDIYQATLWGNEKSFNPEQWQAQRLALELRYARDFEGKDIAKRSIEEIHHQAPLEKDKAQTWLKTLEGLFPNVKKDQTLTGIYLPGEDAHFLFNHKMIGSLGDRELSQRFFSIWLSQQTSAPKLRKNLFGESES